jgi:predicted DNA-binding transcriptional regulator AlpA
MLTTTPAIEPRLLDVRDVARLYSISVRSIWRLCQLGQLPAPVNLGPRLTRWRIEDLNEHIRNMKLTADEKMN